MQIVMITRSPTLFLLVVPMLDSLFLDTTAEKLIPKIILEETLPTPQIKEELISSQMPLVTTTKSATKVVTLLLIKSK